MKLIENTAELEKFCKKLKKSDYLAIDTEFLREKTYFPLLCLIQVAAANDVVAAIDPLAEGIDLSSFYELLKDPKITIVMHGCNQDLEIFLKETGQMPTEVFDTQIAAMVCGLREAVSYKGLVRHYMDEEIDKNQRFTDWSLRPLSEKQISYALDDVIYLYDIYPMLLEELDKKGRTNWIKQEMEDLTDPERYSNEPYNAWKKMKTRLDKPKHLAVLREVCAWREQRAQDKNLPKSRIMRDDTVLEIVVTTPQTMEALLKIRGVNQGFEKSESSTKLLEQIKAGMDLPKEERPKKTKKKTYPSYINPTVELLKVLLKLKAEEFDVASRLIATSGDLSEVAYAKKPDVRCMKGWRYDIFGRDALALKEGIIGLALGKKGKIEIIAVLYLIKKFIFKE